MQQIYASNNNIILLLLLLLIPNNTFTKILHRPKIEYKTINPKHLISPRTVSLITKKKTTNPIWVYLQQGLRTLKLTKTFKGGSLKLMTLYSKTSKDSQPNTWDLQIGFTNHTLLRVLFNNLHKGSPILDLSIQKISYSRKF